MMVLRINCTDSIAYRLGGVAGLLVLALGLWLAAELGAAVLRLVRSRLDPASSSADNSAVPRSDAAPYLEGADPVIVDISIAAAIERRKSLIRVMRSVAAVLVALLLLPPQASVALFIFFGISASIAMAWRDVVAAGGGRFNALRLTGGPPLFFGGPLGLPLFWLITMAMTFIGFGPLTWFAAGANFVCPDHDYSPTESAAFGVAALGCGMVLLRFARRVGARRAPELLAADDRPPVLYLRSFADDALRVETRRMTRSTWVE